MRSRWNHPKSIAVKMRKRGYSIRDIEIKLGIPRSTLSGWLKSIPVAKQYQRRLHQRWKEALVRARAQAVEWHNKQKDVRMQQAKEAALESLAHIQIENIHTIELALAMLYLGEGMKKSPLTALGNSDPRIMRFFCQALKHIYHIPTKDLRCELHIRADQNANREKQYWSKVLKIPIHNFGHTAIDKRTKGRPTYPSYHGVCVVRCGRIAIQRKLVYIATTFCEKIAERRVRG